MHRRDVYGIVAVLTGTLLGGWWIRDSPSTLVPEPWTEEQREVLRRLLTPPTLSAAEWEQRCNPKAGQRWKNNESLDSRCTIDVIVDCPPDCGVYKILREDQLLRRH